MPSTARRGRLGSTTNLAANGNGVINASDYDAWKVHFGEHSGSDCGTGTNVAAAEQASLSLALVAVSLMLIRFRSERCLNVTGASTR
jgi:hypothetical protein